MSFSDYFPETFNGKIINRFSPDALAELPWEVELDLKNKALKTLLKEGNIKAPLLPVEPSPLPRHYRTTGKRRVSFSGNRLFFHMGRSHKGTSVSESLLEPESHQEIYQLLHRFFSSPRARAAALALNYCIIRGSYREHALIFNVRNLNGDIVRILKQAAQTVIADHPIVRSVFIYVDETNSDYYLEAERPEGKLAFKKLCGPEYLALQLDGKKFLYHPTSFSQINESILPVFLSKLEEAANIPEKSLLIDLYCGYGLWSLCAGRQFSSVWGAEFAAESVKMAKKNAQFHYPEKDFRYEAGSINNQFIRTKLPPVRGKKECILLDPPRNGCLPGVIEGVISRRPGKILHMFCGADAIVPELSVYLANGCKIEKLIPFDFFPGTQNVELLAVIEPPKVK